MRIAILLAALLIIIVGTVGFISPDIGMSLRRDYVVDGYGMYAIAAFRLTLGVLCIRFAPASRAPKVLRVFGILVCLQALVQAVGTAFIPLDGARAMLEWEGSHPGLLRVGALIALAIGAFLSFAVTTPSRRSN